MKTRIDIVNKYSSNTGNTEYHVSEYDKNLKLFCEIDSYLNLAEAIKAYPDSDMWWQYYESAEAHDNGEELLNLYRAGGKIKSDRLRIYQIEQYFLFEDIE